MHSVLFVCTGNICRSPMAVGLLRDKVKANQSDWRVESAGTWAMDGSPAALNSRLVMEARGVDLSSHRSRPVTRDLLAEFNLVLTMERGHKEALQFEFPQSAGRIFTLGEMVGGDFDIHDPIGSPLVDFQDAVEELAQLIDAGFARIRELSETDERD